MGHMRFAFKQTHMLTHMLTHTALVLGLMGLTPNGGATETFTATTGADASGKGQKPKQAKPAKATKPPTDKGSAESKTERDKRLQRECRGRPNAGACEGHAS